MTIQDKVKDYVRNQIPALVKNEHAQLKTWKGNTEYFTEYHPIHLEHYLAVLEEKEQLGALEYEANKQLKVWGYSNPISITFSLTTGEPATEADWQALATLLDIK